MNVHEAISEHSRKQHGHLARFLELDALRETAIERALGLCSAGKPFGAGEINRITTEINEHAKNGISPTRVYVTEAMVREFVERSRSQG